MRQIDDAGRLLASAPPDGEDGPSGPTLVAALRDSGLLAACDTLAHHPADPRVLMRALVTVGRASLSAGRLFEGHVNAVKLLRLHGGPTEGIAQGDLLGVWGADGPDPAHIRNGVLHGQKLFASGADVLDRVIVAVKHPDGRPQLVLLRRDQLQGRLFPQEWAVSGMKATASGRCDLEGLAVGDAILLGGPGDYQREPHFQGGVWRYAAVQLGAMQALAAIAADQLQRRGRADAPLQAQRLRRMMTACETVRLWLENAACAVERPSATAEDAETAILARLVTAEAAVAVMNDVDQALGAASFATAHPVDRIRRDLSFYIRQADPDGLGHAATERILANPALRQRWLP
ncbi:acyl-CoA dehydrogenase family protein [Paracoccus yeei]|uniref:Acyl-CoA dehydrogenase n=1 Tax=Paracoccus yeei TaxID=147645 RepID=A0A5P2QRZ6_9RHOB|nr:acyl-CoA dehydrogenase family protein [Paracoccus yeei]QEU08550.1 acyl-CoA dehydrogenase [Paracoccus yeei]